MPECGRRGPGPGACESHVGTFPRLRRRLLFRVARYAVGSVPIGRLAGIRIGGAL